MTHLVPAEPETDKFGFYKAHCGRFVRPNQTTTALTAVECTRCREAFAWLLRKLPDVMEK